MKLKRHFLELEQRRRSGDAGGAAEQTDFQQNGRLHAVFGADPLRLGLEEFETIIGLNCGDLLTTNLLTTNLLTKTTLTTTRLTTTHLFTTLLTKSTLTAHHDSPNHNSSSHKSPDHNSPDHNSPVTTTSHP
ncbi:hypothetical protein F2Q69_00003844 [Brassica cretica]|uniref:DUF1985 domain-containing protein n=1 Tax=Brassica cretica TaxID=69181 RepID=A0A8S9NP81_BRACR|nr:hypothetical protein F2Q69_00003844 [Brassica cretica]